jgi:hypothetical protein
MSSSTYSHPRSTSSSSLPLLHRRRRQWPRFTRMAPPQRSSAPSCIPAFDELSLHPLAGNGSRVVGLGSS